MNNQLKLLHKQITEKKINLDDAAKKYMLLATKMKNNKNISFSSKDKHYLTAEFNRKDDTHILRDIQFYLKQNLSKLLNIDIEDIDVVTNINEYTEDIVKLTEFISIINKEYNLNLSVISFNEYQSIETFTEYLVEKYKEKLTQQLEVKNKKESTLKEETKSLPEMENDQFKEKAINYFKKLLSSVIKLPANRVDAGAPMEKYGIDSIMVMQLTSQLEKSFGSLSKTLFFEYTNIEELTGYFIKSYRNQLIKLLGTEENDQTSIQNPKNYVNSSMPVSTLVSTRKRSRFVSMSRNSVKEKELSSLDIAVIGVSGQYPKARNVQEYWKNLKKGKDCITEIPEGRWDYKLFFDEDKNKFGKTYSKWGGFIDGVDEFDPLFFNISPREAEFIDPQERLFLECVFATIEDAGYTRKSLSIDHGFNSGCSVGVYVGVMYEEYQLYGAQGQIQGMPFALSGSSSSIANRVSYFCNFHGPSMAVDTMCSSSLTAIHLACQSIQQNGCELAIAGGVNVSIHPNKYLMLSQGKFASSKGRCESFGDGGDGYVPGEGVGAVLLKPLSKAIDDGDHIYGIIKATAINHGGKTNGYSVPNPNAQVGVIGQAFKDAGIDAKTISYIEAHGTGTSLGDPIEIAGLTKAFEQDTTEKQFCSIGSAKSNIGHCESAAGIAGITKILLQLKNGQIAPSLHSKSLNPNIDFSKTPFVVQQELTEWKRPVIDDHEMPRRAGVSAFGAGGSNAHVVIEEYISKEVSPFKIAITSNSPAIIILSAKNEERLKELAKQLLEAISIREFSDKNLSDIAYTLQVGREAMEERLGMSVVSIKELEEKLIGFMDGSDDIEDIYRGKVKGNKDALSVFAADEELQEAIEKWIKRKKYTKLLDLWVKGLIFDWNKLYGDTKPRRISLPTYPFAREKFWIPENTTIADNMSGSGIASFLHPLLHQNTSNISEQKFSSTFTGEEFFLSDHVVKGHRIFPGIACLEMARAAIEASTEALENSNVRVRLKNVVWGKPIAMGDEKAQVHIGLFPENNGEIAYEIYSDSGEEDVAVYNQGKAVLYITEDTTTLDIKAIQEECNQTVLSSAQCYETFKAIGLEYGPAHQGIEKIYVGENQILSKLVLPPTVLNTKDQYMLHPGMLDSTLQSSIGFMQGSVDTKTTEQCKLALPFSLQELEILSNCTANMWSWIRYSNGSKPNDKIQKFDIDLCDENGDVCARLKGFSSKVLESEIELSESSPSIGTLMFEPQWQAQEISMGIESVKYSEHLVILCEPKDVALKSIEKNMKDIHLHVMHSKEKGITKRFQEYSLQIFEEIQRIIKEKPSGRVFIQVVISHGNKEKLFFGLSGLLKTAELENPKITGQVIELDNSEEIVKILQENIRTPYDVQIKYENGKRYAKKFVEVNSSEEINIPWNDKGVYLITGGAGGLGQIFAKEILAKVKDTTLILTGRSELDKDKRARLKELESLGARIDYRQVDVTNKESVINLIQNILEKFKKLDGIIHSAGIIRDNFIFKKNREEFEKVLAPKVTGLVNLDEASKKIPLDFFIFFSSIAGGMGNIGQADYACANAFMDEYSGYRNNLVSSNVRYGKTLSINWPLWKDGGMSVDKETEKILMQSMGMIPMQTLNGIQLFYTGLISDHNQLMVTEGKIRRMRERMFNASSKIYTDQTNPFPEVDLKLLKEKIVHKIKVLFGRITKINVSQIDIEEPLESYGIDSVMISMLDQKLEDIFSGLSKTLFFEYQTLEALSEYFISDHKHECVKWTGLGGETFNLSRKSTEKKYDVSEFPVLVPLKAGKKIGRNFTATASYGKREPIAIIGISGCFPQAKTLNEYWENLKAGKDCITEIPKERWSLDGFYHSDQKEATEKWKSYSKWGGFIEEFSEFDPLFFNMSPRESMNIDPQERLFIKSCWEVLEDAGYTRDQLTKQFNNRVGVFAGITKTGFDLYGPDLWKQGEDVYPRTSFSSLANRVSYLLNLHGPSMPVDTMCSASLTAIHEACEHLHMGECEMAIAGGVNLYLHPSSYFLLCSQQMLSTDGKCKSFGLGGNGFVPGEGVGTVLLKCLTQAQKDKDNIYAVIRGSGINHGGKTNGYTVPNPKAQTELIRTTIEKAGVDARSISYIEAHGTGTSLGDPIEITGLTKAFEQDTTDKQFCTIGSVKSNIGHCESAAGIAGVAKVLLQLKNQKLVPSLHSKTLNPNIDFSKTPFVVQQELTEWKRPVINGHEVARCAGISSFGAGGSNAHLVIEEYISKKESSSQIVISDNNPAIIVLSTKNEESLKAQAKQLLEAIANREFPDASLPDIAYTLQVGREAMGERLALSVVSIKELEEKLNGFLENRDDIEGLYRGQVKSNKDALSVFAADEDMGNIIDVWIAKRKYPKLLNLWVKGLIFDWKKLYGDEVPNRISLPTYPFARERYWIPENTTSTDNMVGTGVASFLHPLLHQNTSNLSEQKFSSTFTGEEFFLSGHVVKGQRILPGVAYLELARTAVEYATETLREGDTCILLKNVVWLHPIAVGDEKVQVHIRLLPEDNGEIAYEIYCNSGEGDVTVYNQGKALLCTPTNIAKLDIKKIQKECNQRILSSTQCYEAFKAIGLEYGPGHKGIKNIYVGENQVISELTLPSIVSDTKDQYVLHPGMLDSALQSSIGFILGSVDKENAAQVKPALPFALQELEILSNCTTNMWAWIRYSNGSKSDDKIQKIDIDLCDENGKICAQLKGFSSRILEGEVELSESSTAMGTLILESKWKEQEVSIDIEAVEYSEHLVLCNPKDIALENIEKDMKDVNLLVMHSKEKGITDRFKEYSLQIFEEIQRIIKEKPSGRVFIQVVISNENEEKLFCGLSGLLKTAELENPKITGQIIELDNPEEIVKILIENLRTPYDRYIKYENGKRYTSSFVEVEYSEEVNIPWKEKGIYLITGGVGGLGQIFAKEILAKVKNTTLILTGRSELNEDKRAQLKTLESLEARIDYRQVDVTNKGSVNDLMQSIQEEFGKLNGIIHSAGIIRDNFILKKNREEFKEVLAPKVKGLVNLDEASKNMPLDFFVLFSSVAGSMGNMGQADYACGNAFMDAYAEYRNTLLSSNVRHGKTLSINWPLWKNGGMSVDKATENMMQSMGIIPMHTKSGINALYHSFSSGREHVVVMEGNVDLIKEKQLLIRKAKPMSITTSSKIKLSEKASISGNSFQEHVVDFIKKILSDAIKLSPERIQLETPFEKYGVDSIIQLNLIRELEKVTGEVSKTLLFEYSTVQELADYLVKNYSEKFLEFSEVEKDEVDNSKGSISVNNTGFQKKNRFQRLNHSNQITKGSETEDIAIIGISGRYPLSNTMEEFWANLKAGNNCITEVSSNRWNTLLPGNVSELEYQYPDKKYYGGFLDNINRFDHSLFEISQDHVMELSPELRLFLETAWETFEDAGYNRLAVQDIQARYQMGVGVFVGTMYSQYLWNMPSLQQAKLNSNMTDWQIANRTSHFFNLTGPSIMVNSACSSSLTAIHQACESIKLKTCSMCIAGGINLTLDPSKYDTLQHSNILGSGNKSKSFGTGDGYIPGEGVGAVLLKPLSMAIKDHDRIYAVIKSSFVNHSGGRQMYSAPDPKQQAQLIVNSIKRSGIDPETIGYIESAANGSPLGDPIEIIAITNAFEQYTDKKQYCAMGSVKSNLGHLEAASGISQLSKVLMQLKHQTLVPTINANPQNPSMTLKNSAFYLQEETESWNQIKDQTGKDLPRRSMINSFGAGGSYSNMIIEEFESKTIQEKSELSFEEYLIVFSAKTEWSLMKYLDKIREFIEKNSNIEIADIAGTLHKINHNLDQRVAIVATSINELLKKINHILETRESLTESIYISSDQRSYLTSLSSSTIDKALEKRNLQQLAEHWIAGGTINFNQLYKDSRNQWITLPKYCFDHNIEFDFKEIEPIENNIVELNDEFYQKLLFGISNGELSEDEFEEILKISGRVN
ncbi:MAG: SDR family NAD(P)-dependent oxidoreductase [Deltaproteobacteria bacterium]|nr:SDR family NAD(P)-dependent oxidoreductase [Deltaproteobacteria bacterium]